MVAEPGYGNTIEYGDASTFSGSTTWVFLAEIVDFDGPNSEATNIDVSTQASRFRKFISGMIDHGEVSMTFVFDKDEFAIFKDTLLGEQRGYRITTNGGTVFGLDCLMSGTGVAIPQDDKIEATVTLKVTDDYTYTPAA